MTSAVRILILNAALNGRTGNTAVLLDRAAEFLKPSADVRHVILAEHYNYERVREELIAAQAIIVGTGTHWDSWSNLLQRFLEDTTPDEGEAPWFAKPAGVLVSMHSVGGKGVVSRLQGVLSTLGCLIPPMSGMVYSYANQTALSVPGALAADLWSLEDLDVVSWNVLTAARSKNDYRKWLVDRAQVGDKWIVEE
jgi:multimeric flavodoxin WrbA